MDRRRDRPDQSYQGQNQQPSAARLFRQRIEVSRRSLVKLHGYQSF
jgi:hypothetical protein